MSQDCKRISVAMKLDCRAGRQRGLAGKIAAVENRLGRPLATGRVEDDDQGR